MLNRLGNKKLHIKMMLSFYPATILLIIVMGCLLVNIHYIYVRKLSISVVEKGQEQIIRSIESNMEICEKIVENIAYNSIIQDYLSRESLGAHEEYLQLSYVDSIINSMMSVMGKSSNLTIIRFSPTDYEVIPVNFHGLLKSYTSNDLLANTKNHNYQIVSSERVNNKQWFIDLINLDEHEFWLQIEDDNEFNNISLIKKVALLDSAITKEVGAIVLTLKLDDIFPDGTSQEFGSFYNMIYDVKNQSFYGKRIDDNPDNAEISQELKAFANQNEKHKVTKNRLIVRLSIDDYNWELLSVVALDEMEEIIRKTTAVVALFGLVALVILFLITNRLSRDFAKNVLAILEHLKLIQNGDLDTSITVKNNGEFNEINAALNTMQQNIKQLIYRAAKTEKDLKTSELKALQAQIKPHFLYNSLSTISRLADVGEVNKINHLVQSLVKFYRISLSHGKDEIKISEELKQIEAYVNIMLVRLWEYFSIEYDIEEDVLENTTTKLILQPFIENAIEHGIGENGQKIHILVRAFSQENNIIFEISDTGVGMEQEKADLILASEEIDDKKGYGIKNIAMRLRLKYGDDYGVNIKSSKDGGTVVTIRIPKQFQDNG